MSNREQPEPTPGELMAIAYVNGELAESFRRKFEVRLGRDPALMREVTKQRTVLDLVDQLIASAAVTFLNEGSNRP